MIFCNKILKNDKYLIILLIILIILFLYLVYYVYINQNNTYNKKYIIRDDCEYLQSKTLINIINENINNFKYILYLPCIYENILEEYNKFKYNKNGIYFLIDNVDIMIGKEFLYENVFKHYGEEKTIKLMPRSWLPYDNSLDKFIEKFDKNKLYILKKNTQRQNGIQISNNVDDIKNMIEKDKNTDFPYIIIQELLQDPYLINNRKINLRVYVLMIRDGSNTKLYVYNDGFMYYTAEFFEKGSNSIAKNITTGYIDRQVYQENPLTQSDFKKYLDSDRILSDFEQKIKNNNEILSYVVFNNIYNLIKNIFSVYFDKVGINKKLYNNIKFQLFGCDVAIDNTLNAKLMEINKGPDLSAKDQRDSELKHNLVRDIFKTVGLIDNINPNGFINLNS